MALSRVLPGRRWPALGGLSLAVLSFGVLAVRPPPAAHPPPVRSLPPGQPWMPLVHWRHATHDWLLVADRASARVLVYDAADGRPLGALGPAQGLLAADALIADGDTVWVLGGERPQAIALPSVLAGASELARAGD